MRLATMPDAELPDETLLEHVWQGDRKAAEELYRRYSDRVRALTRANISRGLSRRLDVEDIVQSVFRRFFQAAGRGRYHLPTGEELWGLLLVITLNRLRTEEQFQRAGKRDLRQTVGLPEGSGVADQGDTGAFLTLAVEEALGHLPEHYRAVVRLRMDGHEVADVARAVDRSKRTVERMLQEARVRLRSLLELEPRDATPG